ncbi:MAG: hypothetical protein KCHDKBKB_00692 [Elusimicrobia bacterium]|nr:hypothetical protein [Elusimicrobiota bacterium]
MIPDHSLLTIKEVAKILRVSTDTLKRWESKGKFKSVRLGPRGDRRYERDYILKFMEEA